MGQAKNTDLRHDFFDHLDTEEANYFLGLMFTDGAIRRNRNEIALELKGEDFYILETFREILNIESPIYHYKNRDMNRLSFYSSHMKQSLISHGCTPLKPTRRILTPSLHKDRHFIRGLYDGDGTVTLHRNGLTKPSYPEMKITSKLSFCEVVRVFVSDHIPDLKQQINKDNGEVTFRFRVVSHQAATLASILYNDCTYALERKRIPAQEIQRWSVWKLIEKEDPSLYQQLCPC